jgi:hypothetical protein
MKDLHKRINIVSRDYEVQDRLLSYILMKKGIHFLATRTKLSKEEWIDQRLYWVGLLKDRFSCIYLVDRSKAHLYVYEANLHPETLAKHPELFQKDEWADIYGFIFPLEYFRSCFAKRNFLQTGLEELQIKLEALYAEDTSLMVSPSIHSLLFTY